MKARKRQGRTCRREERLIDVDLLRFSEFCKTKKIESLVSPPRESHQLLQLPRRVEVEVLACGGKEVMKNFYP